MRKMALNKSLVFSLGGAAVLATIIGSVIFLTTSPEKSNSGAEDRMADVTRGTKTEDATEEAIEEMPETVESTKETDSEKTPEKTTETATEEITEETTEESDVQQWIPKGEIPMDGVSAENDLGKPQIVEGDSEEAPEMDGSFDEEGFVSNSDEVKIENKVYVDKKNKLYYTEDKVEKIPKEVTAIVMMSESEAVLDGYKEAK